MRMTLRLLFVVLSLALHACGGSPVRDAVRYTVKSGDTLFAIATRHGVDYRDLARWNGIGRDYRIYPGQVLSLRATARPAQSAATPKSPAPPRSAATQIPPPSFKWNWPATSTDFSSTARPNGGLGLTINGRAGQEVFAAAGGKVVYSGLGLLGYGQLLIVKHDDTYLSAYGYTQTVAVREGEQVSAGQKIATMGNGPAGTPLLYFEIRANGRPVDPLSMLPRQQ